jgi:hypothetical protein
MQFDEKKYTDLLIAHRRNKTNPEDLLERYAITLPAGDAEIAEQVKRVREYWNKIGLGQSRASEGAKWCRTQDELLRARTVTSTWSRRRGGSAGSPPATRTPRRRSSWWPMTYGRSTAR